MLCYASSPVQVLLMVGDGAVVLVQRHHHIAAVQVSQQSLTVGTNRDGPDQNPVTVHLWGRGQSEWYLNQVLLLLF